MKKAQISEKNYEVLTTFCSKQTQSNLMSEQLESPKLAGMLIHGPDEAKTVAEGFSGFF